MSSLSKTVFLVQLICTLSMTGVIWFVQVVHYPLFLRVPATAFVQYEVEHATRTGWVVGPLMCLELIASLFFLLPALRPIDVSAWSAWLGAGLVGVIWASTAFVQVPLHDRLAAGFSADVLSTLVRTNWVRTVAWTSRAMLVVFWTAKLISVDK